MVEFGELTIIVPINPESLGSLKDLLNLIGDDIPGNAVINFSRLSTVHFMRWVVLDSSQDISGTEIPAALAFGVDFDGSTSAFLTDFVANAQDGLDNIYQHCVGWPGANKPQLLIDYLLRHNLNSSGYYAGYRGRSLAQVNAESDLRDSIESFVNANLNGVKGKTSNAIFQQIFNYLFPPSGDKFDWAKTAYIPYRGNVLPAVVMFVAALMALFLIHHHVLMTLAFVFLAFIALFLIVLRTKETTDAQWIGIPDPNLVAELLADEDRRSIVQNQLTHIVNIKPGLFRLATLRFVLSTIDWLAKNLFFKGELGGIPSIHFARWVIIDQGRRLLFFSNFDGSWENYLGDFIDKANVGLTGVWSNTDGFPKSSFLVFNGATNQELFKNWTRYHQIPTQVWYTAVPRLTVENINNNTAIRTGLLQTSAEQADAWTRLI